LDAETGAMIVDESTLTDVTGTTAAIVVDLRTYNATGRFTGPTDSLAIHGVATHLIPPGGFGYDLTHLRPLVMENASRAIHNGAQLRGVTSSCWLWSTNSGW